jgi:hypothetical protein
MLSLKTTTILAALIATISVIATTSAVPALIPQAFAQDAADGTDGTNFRDNDVVASQSNSITKDITQTQSQSVGSSGTNDGTDGTNGRTDIDQDADQGFCELSNQANAIANAGSTVTQTQSNSQSAGDDLDCS